MGIMLLLAGVLFYQSILSQNIEIAEFIQVEKAAGNIVIQSTCELEISNQCKVREEKYSGRSIGILDEMNDQMDNTKSMSRVSFGLGIIFIIYSSYEELLKMKQYLLN
mgnify:CR=1 FL=1